MNRKIIPIVVFLLFTFSVVKIAYGMQQTLIMDLNRNHTQQGYYTGKIYGKLDDTIMTAIADCQQMCMVKEPPKICMVRERPKMCMIKGHESVNNLTCMEVDKALKGNEQSIEDKEY